MEDQFIRRAVLDILEDADMDEMTESKVRWLAAEKLGTNLDASASKKLVRKTVEEFLVARTDEGQGANEEEGDDARKGSAGASGKGGKAIKDEGEEQQPQRAAASRGVSKTQALPKDSVQSGDQLVCQLSNRRNVSVQEWRGKTLISIREYYEKNGEMLPTSKGISLTVDQWEALKRGVPAIEDAIQRIM